MSVTLNERRERAEGRIESLLEGMDETVQMVYRTLFERGADYDELTEKQEVARLEGFHDYIVVREETGVEHPGLEEYIEVKKRLGDELLSFSTARHRKPIDGEGPAPELAEEKAEVKPVFFDLDKSSASATEPPAMLITGSPGYGSGFNSKMEMLSNVAAEKARGRRAADLPLTPDDKEDVPEKVEEPVSVARSIFDDDEEEVVISSKATDEETAGGFVARVPENKPEPAFESLLHADKEEREDEAELIAKADEEKEEEATPRISANDIVDKEFTFKLGGLDQEEVDDFLDELAQFMATSHEASVWLEKVKSVEGQEFTKKSGFKKGYVPSEVKEYLTALGVELEIRASEA